MRIAAVLLALISAPIVAAAEKPIDWHSAAVGDVEAAYRIYRENHPGWFDPTNPGFRFQLARARQKGLTAAGHVRNYADYAEALGTFSGVLSDGHARIFAKPLDPPGQSFWPEFITAWRGGSLYIQSGAPLSGTKIGDRLLSCDGKPITRVVADRLKSQGMRTRDAGHWWARSPQAFVDTPTMATAHPKRCSFATPAGVRSVALQWVPAPPDIAARLRASGNGEKTPIGLTETRSGLFLIGLSDFNPDERGVAAYQRLFSDLQSRQRELQRARALILDLRWNDGGSSDWPQQTAEVVWGKAAVRQRLADYYRNVRIWWRASPGNIQQIVDTEADNRANGNIETADAIHQTAIGMKAALASGRPFYVEAVSPQGARTEPSGTAFRTPVYVITPGGCASACLDALDIFTRFANVKLIGAPTASDTSYLDARLDELPSGHGLIVIPRKIWMHRLRASGQFYRPDIEVDDLDWSTATFLNAIEEDLKALKPRTGQVGVHR